MSRHRNVRSMNYDEDYEGYDDVYGHSVEDDFYCTSPGTVEQYTFDRSSHHPLSTFVSPTSQPIAETNEEEEEDFDEGSNSLTDSSASAGLRCQLGDIDQAKLNSCIEAMQNIMGDTTPESVMVAAALQNGFDPNAAVDYIMNQMEMPKPQRQTRNRRGRGNDTETQRQQPLPSVAKVTPTDGQRYQENRTLAPQPVATSAPVVKAAPAPSKGNTVLAADDSQKQQTPKTDGATVGASVASKSKAGKGDEGSEATQDTTLKSKSTKDAYKDRKVEGNEFSDVGADDVLVKRDATEASGVGAVAPPGLHKSASKAKMDRLDVQKEYDKRKAGGKDYINLVVIGHVDAGKSTLMGHVLYQLGFVNKRTMHRYEQDSKKIGKGSFAYAWVLDETEEERSRGVTMDIAQTRFETNSKVVNLLDAPGHKDFIPNMITGAAQADVAILVINATRGEFETGFEMGGQTREHAMLVRSLGVSQLLVAVNKMDTVGWSKERYDEVVHKLGAFLKQAGFRESDISFVPCSGLNGENLTKPSQDKQLTSWYKGPTLVDQIDMFRPPERPVIDKPFRMCVSDVFKGMGAGFSVGGTIQTGNIQAGDRVSVISANETAIVKSVTIDDAPVGVAFAGDNTVLTLTGIDMTNLSIGSILCDPLNPIEPTTKFRARIVVFNIEIPITQGFPVVLHYQSISEQAHIKRLVSQLHKSTGEVVKKKPRCLVKNSSAIVDICVDRPVSIELYREYKELGRFMLRSSGSTIAAGIVTEILRDKSQTNGLSS